VGDDEKQIRRDRNSSAEIAAKTGPLTDGEVIREVQQPRRARAGLQGDDVGDRPEKRLLPKQEVNVDRSRRRSVFCPTTWSD
jgi:hypothetical protein